MSERLICVVYTESTSGQESEYHDWYDRQHLHDVARVPGVLSAQRYELADMQAVGSGPPARCLAIYEIEGDPKRFAEELRSRFGTDEMPASPALDAASISMTFWTPHGEQVTA